MLFGRCVSAIYDRSIVFLPGRSVKKKNGRGGAAEADESARLETVPSALMGRRTYVRTQSSLRNARNVVAASRAPLTHRSFIHPS